VKTRGLAILAVAALTGAVAIVAVVATGAGASSRQAATGWDFVVQQQGRTSFVDVRPKAPKGKFLPGPGDSFTSRAKVFDQNGVKEIGRISQLCTMTVADPATFQCQIGLVIFDGQFIIAAAMNPLTAAWKAPIIGGDGVYDGVQGSVEVTPIGGNRERWILTGRY
jgi:hypothetical protein